MGGDERGPDFWQLRSFGYNARSADERTRATVIRTENVFSTIAEIAETLSLTNEPDKLLQTSLDTLAEVLGIESGWVQTVETGGNLTLAASRGLTADITRTLSGLKKSHQLVHEVTGLGHKVVITNLSSSDMEGIEPFRRAGIRWLIAVPLMTYRVHGILGAASRYRKRLDKHTPDLIMVTGRLIATALVKTNLARTHTFSGEQKNNGKKVTAESLEESRNRIRQIQSKLAAAKAEAAGFSAGIEEEPLPPVGAELPPATEEAEESDAPAGTADAITTGSAFAEEPDEMESPVIPLSHIDIPLDVEKLLREISLGSDADDVPVAPMPSSEADDAEMEGPEKPAVNEDLPQTVTETAEPEDTAGPETAPWPASEVPESPEGATPEIPAPALEGPGPAPESLPETATDLPGEAVEDTGHFHGNGKKPEGAAEPVSGEEDWFIRHSRKMASFRARHAPLH